jgi:hypothetical protein
MTELNKNSFFFYFHKKTGGRHDPALLIKTIELLKEWLPDDTDYPEKEYSLYQLGQRDYKQFLMNNLK